MDEVARLAALLRARGPAVVLTGAGISTESGIPDFRSPTGIWARADPMEYASLAAFRRDPERVWSFYRLRLAMLAAAEPNCGHLALAELERRGHVRAIVAQNIDLLHARAGSRDVVEVHGSIRSCTCPRCRESVPLALVLAALESSEEAPRCACGAVLKPDVVFFGEVLPQAAVDRSVRLARETGVLLVVGSSLEVYPVAGLPDETLAHRGAVAIVNRGPTPYDRRAEVRVEAGAGDVLEELLASISRPGGMVGPASTRRTIAMDETPRDEGQEPEAGEDSGAGADETQGPATADEAQAGSGDAQGEGAGPRLVGMMADRGLEALRKFSSEMEQNPRARETVDRLGDARERLEAAGRSLLRQLNLAPNDEVESLRAEVARLEARLDTVERAAATAPLPPREDPDREGGTAG